MDEHQESEDKKIEIDPTFLQLMRMLVSQNHACATYLDYTRKRVSVILDIIKHMDTVLSLGKNTDDFRVQIQEYEFFAQDVIDNLNNLEKSVMSNEKAFLILLENKKIIENKDEWDDSNVIFGKNGGLSWIPPKKSCETKK
jgi:hypothetical protein